MVRHASFQSRWILWLGVCVFDFLLLVRPPDDLDFNRNCDAWLVRMIHRDLMLLVPVSEVGLHPQGLAELPHQRLGDGASLDVCPRAGFAQVRCPCKGSGFFFLAT